jgi:hypothetical protein
MATLETQYKNFLKDNPNSNMPFEEWNKVNARLIKQALVNMMKADEELGLYNEPFKHKVETIPAEEILANRSNAYEFIDFDKQETLEEVAENYWAKQPYNEDAFIEGAKWQQERSYSEEDLKEAFFDGWQLRDGDLPFPKAKKKWFEEIKKK